ncbi:hypothetical protein [Ancylobacter sp. IITR112]|uniref:hypothetical protein n=1 Tax=Ancylobacter sp. IITR112 TaxID=3138073 RepID=UPI00352B6822
MRFRFRKAYVDLVDYRLHVLRARLAGALRLEATPVEVPGERHHPGNLHAIFLIWQPRATPGMCATRSTLWRKSASM